MGSKKKEFVYLRLIKIEQFDFVWNKILVYISAGDINCLGGRGFTFIF